MGRFQSIISSVAAIGTIVVTVVAVYRGLDNQKQFNLKQQLEIQNLQKQLLEKQLSGANQQAKPADSAAEVVPGPSGQAELPPLPPVHQAPQLPQVNNP